MLLIVFKWAVMIFLVAHMAALPLLALGIIQVASMDAAILSFVFSGVAFVFMMVGTEL